MKNNMAIFVIFAVLLLIGGTIAGILISNQKENIQKIPKQEIVTYFAETASTRFVQSIGQPIEGISPPMFLELFLNLRERDLDNVQTALGYYKYENAQLIYKPVGPQTHSAAQMITEKGYETLLDNLSNRFNIELENINSVDEIINKLYEEQANSNEINFNTLQKGTNSEITIKQQRVIKSVAEWSNLWTEMFPTQMIASAINFNEKMLIAVFQGQKPTSGYEIEITQIIERENEIVVQVKETSLGTNCAADAVVTSPYHIVEINKSSKPLRFMFVQEITEC